MPANQTNLSRSDVERDAEKYHKLLLEVETVTSMIREMELGPSFRIEDAMRQFLPFLCSALDAESAFIARLFEDGELEGLGILASFPEQKMMGRRLISLDPFHRVLHEGKSLVVESLDDDRKEIIHGLEMFNATSAILTRFQSGSQVYVVGVCNRTSADEDPFLATDRMTLENILGLITLGMQLGERRRRDLENIQRITATLNTELNPKELFRLVVRDASRVFASQFISLMLWDEKKQNLIIVAGRGLPNEYHLKQSISKEKFYEVVSVSGLEPIAITNLQASPFRDLFLIEKDHFCSVLSIPLIALNVLIGILNIYSKDDLRSFHTEEIELAQIFANHAAIAIQNTQLYETSKTRGNSLKALYEASKMIAAQKESNQHKILQDVLEHAVESVTGIVGSKATVGSIQLYDPKTNELVFECIYPDKGFPGTAAGPGERLKLDHPEEWVGRKGVTVRTAKLRKPQLVPDVSLDPDYIRYNKDTRSELAVPLLDGEKLFGVLDVESNRRNGFDHEDVEALQALAELVVLALKNIDRIQELSQANAVAVMGAWGAEITHDIHREVGHIRWTVDELHQRQDLPADVKERLSAIDHFAEELSMLEFSEQPLELIDRKIDETSLIDDVIRTTVQRISPSFPHLSWKLELGCPGVRVAIEARWLYRVIRHLIYNAEHAVENKNIKQVFIRSLIKDAMVEVQVEDTGSGVRTELQDFLFSKPVSHKPDDKRKGRGLLLVNFFVKQHGGSTQLVWSHPGEGACFSFTVPLWKNE